MTGAEAVGRPLAGHVALVTGSASGIGAAVARAFAARGASVLVNSARSVEAGTALAAEFPDAVYVQADISIEADAQRLVAVALERWGRIDTLVNNAGTTVVIDHRDLAAANLGVWRDIFAVNVFGTWSVTVAAADALRRTGGSVVNIGSTSALTPTGSSLPYAASKAAVHHMTVLLARALGPEVRVNAVAPGLTDTPWTADWDEQRRRVGARAPLRRSGRPEEVAEMVLALATAAYVTGQIVAVDGGLSIVT
jgi:ketoreductase RED2